MLSKLCPCPVLKALEKDDEEEDEFNEIEEAVTFRA